MANATEADLWIDANDPFDQKNDFAAQPQPLMDDDDLEPLPGNNVLNPEIVSGTVPTPPAPVVVQPPEPEPIEDDEPLSEETPEGRITYEKTKKGWSISLEPSGGGQIETFYGKTKNEATFNLAKGKLNATKKIREQNRQIKLGTGKEAPTLPQVVTQAQQVAGRALTADDVFELKTEFALDPVKAMENWFVKRTGTTPEKLMEQAARGEKAERELTMESIHKTFLANNPGYFPDADYENYRSLIAYLAKNKIGRTLTPKNVDEMVNALWVGGFYTVDNLDEAYEELSTSGLLVEAPRTPDAVTPPAAAPAQQREDGRIVRTETRPRAGLGIRDRELSPVRAPEPTQPPSVEDMESWTNEQLDAAIAKATRDAAKNRRR